MSSSQPSAVSEPESGADQAAVQSNRSGGHILLWIFIVVLALLVAATVGTRIALANTYLIPSESMEPTLQVGQRITVDPEYYDSHELQRGDIVVFDGEGAYSPYQSQNQFQRSIDTVLGWIGIAPAQDAVVKRVIGIGGDEVSCCSADGLIVVNGDPLDEPYLAQPDTPASRDTFNVTVPEGRFFALGDNRHVSFDSRALLGAPGGGMISEAKIIGPVIRTE